MHHNRHRFFALPEKLGESMDLDHASTCILGHWPGKTPIWLDYLRRMANYSPALGEFVSIDRYFENTHYSGSTRSFETDTYRSKYLPTAVAEGLPNPVLFGP